MDGQLARQQDLVDSYRFLSPAVVAHEAMTDLAGTGVKRYRHFMRQVNSFHDENQDFFFPRVFAEKRMTEAAYQLMPRFEWREEDRYQVRSRVLIGMIGLLLPVLVILAFGLYKLKSYPRA